ncbi:hypothetical protein [Picosynechococcus sp. NKBG15041c]|uniref:hypothetical protein n=1 Tax=Picosynechococcus sp. NKBG15041c TaxID=1407650 RepID=UPI00046379B0|nr:hypothetical protein [Picosynechococcus sp. NKBG15041c]
MAREFGSGVWRYVTLNLGGSPLKYVFNSKLKDSLKTEFGQTDITAQFNVQGAVLTPRRPKPARASKRLIDGFEGSYCSSDKVRTLKADGWSITRAKIGTFNQTDLSRVLYVNINGVKYAWRRPRNLGGEVDLQALGVETATDQTDLVFGADFPKPAQAVRDITGQGSYRSFVDNSRVDGATLDNGAVSAGWKLVRPQEISSDALLNRTIGA